MPALTRRRSENQHHVTWQVYYDDINVGFIGERSGVPVDVVRWAWSCGFYPGLDPGQHRNGTAETFDLARTAFEAAWKDLLPKVPEGAFDEYREYRDMKAEIRAMRARGEKLDTEYPSSLMHCACGVTFDSHVHAMTLVHAPHIYAAQAEGRKW
jgi:hypothetical protein